MQDQGALAAHGLSELDGGELETRTRQFTCDEPGVAARRMEDAIKVQEDQSHDASPCTRLAFARLPERKRLGALPPRAAARRDVRRAPVS